MAVVIINEVLTFVKCYFGKVANGNLISTLLSFYNENDIIKAKDILYNICIKFLTGDKIGCKIF